MYSKLELPRKVNRLMEFIKIILLNDGDLWIYKSKHDYDFHIYKNVIYNENDEEKMVLSIEEVLEFIFEKIKSGYLVGANFIDIYTDDYDFIQTLLDNDFQLIALDKNQNYLYNIRKSYNPLNLDCIVFNDDDDIEFEWKISYTDVKNILKEPGCYNKFLIDMQEVILN